MSPLYSADKQSKSELDIVISSLEENILRLDMLVARFESQLMALLIPSPEISKTEKIPEGPYMGSPFRIRLSELNDRLFDQLFKLERISQRLDS